MNTTPDIEFQICAQSGAVLASTNTFPPNTLPYPYLVNTSSLYMMANNTYKIKAFDDDFIEQTPDELMGELTIKVSGFMANPSSKPETVQVSGSGFILTCEILWF